MAGEYVIYKAKIGGLIENEFDHVLIGQFDGIPQPNKEEVDDWKWINTEELKKDVKENPEKYTYWFKLILGRVLKYPI